ncbi:MAG: sugar phosphate nucleotidyltransferase, partial [Burkholderiales bacterium]
MSRQLLPKQFLPLVSAQTMLQETVARARRVTDARPPLVIVSEEHRFLAAEQLRAMGAADARLLLEPAGRGTAPAAALACLYAAERDADAIVLLLPADHLIADVEAFLKCVGAAAGIAHGGNLVTFGMRPTTPATGYGYIVRGEAAGAGFRLKQFVEKPDAARAAQLIGAGDAYWNSGMFVFGAAHFLAELEQHRADIVAAAREAWSKRSSDLDFIRPGR